MKIVATSKYKRDYKRAVKRRWDMSKLDRAVAILASGQPIPPSYHDHALSGNRAGQRDMHIGPDWLLIYHYGVDSVTLEGLVSLDETGTHSDVFGNSALDGFLRAPR